MADRLPNGRSGASPGKRGTGMTLADQAAVPSSGRACAAPAGPQADGAPATGYLIIGGLATARQIQAGAVVNQWLREHGLQVPPPPLRIVVSGRRVWMYAVDAGPMVPGTAPDGRLGAPWAWRPIRVTEVPFPAGQARIAATAQVVESSPERAMLQLLQRLPGHE
jgi:hypothetical protein